MGMFRLMASSYPMHLSLYRENTPISSPSDRYLICVPLADATLESPNQTAIAKY